MKRLRLFLILFALLLVWVGPASAHGYLLRSIPEDRSTLERAPTRLQYWFSEDLEPQFSKLVLRDSEGTILIEGGVDPENNTLMALKIPPNSLADGAYIVELTPAFSSDGHVSLSTNVFFVGNVVGDIASQRASTLPQPLEIIWKLLLLGGTHLLFGTGMLYLFVLLPAWGNKKYVAGYLPPRVMQRLNRLIWIGLALAIMGNALALLQQSTVFFNTGLTEVITGNLWQVVRIGSRFGDVWGVRMVLLVIMGILHASSILYRERYPNMIPGFWSAGTWCMALILGAQAVISHASGSLIMPWLALTMHWLHTLASSFWVGGLAALALVLPIALQPLEPNMRSTVILSAMRHYSFLVVGSLAVVITTGIYNSSNWFFDTQEIASTYGAALGIKILMVIVLIGVGALHHFALHPQLAQRWKVASLPLVRQAGEFRATLNGELLIAIVVLLLASVLSSTPIPQPIFLQEKQAPLTQSLTVNDLQVTATISPGGTQVNTIDVTVQKLDNVPQDNLSVTVQLSTPNRDVRGRIHDVEALGEGLYATSIPDINIEGRWWSSIDIRTADGDFTRAAFEWQISEQANIVRTFTPSMVTILAAFAVTGAVSLVLLPSARRFYRTMDLKPQSLIIAFGMIVISIGLLAASIVMIENQRVALLAAENPLPTIVNSSLPTQASVDRGDALYHERCSIWQSVTDFRAFMNQVDRFRDEVIYDAVQNGWREMPACNAPLDEAQTWNIVNFVRVLQYNFKVEQ